MKKKAAISMGLGVLFVVLCAFGLSWGAPPTMLMVVPGMDGALYKMTCDDASCSGWVKISGKLRDAPAVTWDDKAQEWVIVGVNAENKIFMGTFDKTGKFNEDWHQIIPGASPVGAGLSGMSIDTLRSLSCSNGQVAKWNGSIWACSDVGTSPHTHAGGDITSGIVSASWIDSAIARDSEVSSLISTHTANASAHHTRYTNAEAVEAIKAADGSGSGLDADLLDGRHGTDFAYASHNHSGFYVNRAGDTMTGVLNLPPNGLVAGTDQLVLSGGNVGIGTTSLVAKLDVRTSNGNSVYALTTSPGNSWGVYGVNSNSGGGGIYGFATASSGFARGVYGVSNSSTGEGVYGKATSTIGGNSGVLGENASPDGWGVLGANLATSGTAYGVFGRSFSASGIGVQGQAEENSGFNTGVLGQTSSPNGIGVYGRNNATSGTAYGVRGVSTSTSGQGGYFSGFTGVYGESTASNGNGIIGVANNGTAAWAVHGWSTSGYAGHFAGKVLVNGDLSASGTKPFKIDHPLDPTNKYLMHYAIESPTVQNMYNGTIVLDTYGEAVVHLPDYFDAINTEEFTYTLTPIGTSMPGLHIAEEVQNSQFKISGGVGGKKVSWMLIAQRNDPWVKNHPAKDVVDKPKEEVGTYLYPQGHGQPESLSLTSVHMKRQTNP